MKYKGVWLTVCLLALCIAVTEYGGNLYRRAVAHEGFPPFSGSLNNARIEVPHAKRYQPKQVLAPRPSVAAQAELDVALEFSRDPDAWFAGNTEWVSGGNNVWEGFYVSPYRSTTPTTGDNPPLDCIGCNYEIASLAGWQANVGPFSSGSSGSGEGQFAVGYPGASGGPGAGGLVGNGGSILPANTSNAAIAAPQTNASASNDGTVTAGPSTTNALTHNLESARSATQMEGPVTNGTTGLLSDAAMSGVIGAYQTAGGLVSTHSAPGEFNLGEIGRPQPSDGRRIVATTGGSSSNSTSGSRSSNSTGYDSQSAANSVLAATGNAVTNQEGSSGAGWSVGTSGNPWGAQDPSSQALHFPLDPVLNPTPLLDPIPLLDPDPLPAPDPLLNPVPEPSQIVLMFTVVALVALAAKRSAINRRMAARSNG